MSFEEIIKEESKFANYEYQVKFKILISESDLIHLGARKLGVVFHEDRFFIAKNQAIKDSDELVRIRKEGNEDYLFTYKGPIAQKKLRNRLVINRTINEQEVRKITEDYQEVITINKRRTIFVLDRVRILLDKVDYLGLFIEFDLEKEADYGMLDPILEKLHLDPDDSIKLSYFELALISTQPLKRSIFKIYYKLEKFAFGTSSAIMTVMGIIVGLSSAQQSTSAILGGIASVGMADSMSDALGVYTAKKSERGSSEKVAARTALYTFWSKLFFSMSFLMIFMLAPIKLAVIISIIWGLGLLAGIHFLISFVQEEKVFLGIIKNVGLAVMIILISYGVGLLVTR